MSDVDALLYSPPEISDIGTQYLAARRKQAAEGSVGLSIGIPRVEEFGAYVPAQAGDLVTIIARPGNGKTGLMLYWARRTAERILNDYNKAVVYVTVEQTVEELYAFLAAAKTGINTESMKRGALSAEQWEILLDAQVRLSVPPLYLIGNSVARRKQRQPLTISNISLSLKKMEERYGLTPEVVFLDYLQIVPTEGRHNGRTEAVSATLDRCKDGAGYTACPWVVGVQATREVDTYRDQIPGMNSGQWTSNIEQSSDYVFSTVRPGRYREIGQEFAGKVVEDKNMFLLSILKQRIGNANLKYWLNFNPAYNKLDELELKNQQRIKNFDGPGASQRDASGDTDGGETE